MPLTYYQIMSCLSTDSLFDHSGLFPRVFDMVLIGDKNVQYATGVAHVIRKLERTCDIRTRRYSVYGQCALLAVLLCCGIDPTHFFQKEYSSHEERMNEFVKLLPDEAYQRCNHRVFIHSSFLFFFQNDVDFEYACNKDLVDSCTRSIQRPLRITNFMSFAGNIPQLFVNMRHIKTTSSLWKEGVQDAENFFSSRHSSGILRWYMPSSCDRSKTILLFLAPMLFVCLFSSSKKWEEPSMMLRRITKSICQK